MRLDHEPDPAIFPVPCPACDGLGEWDEGPLPASSGATEPDYGQVFCSECDGTGRIMAEAEPRTFDDLVDEAAEALASLDTTLANLPPLDPDVEAMITRPAATVAGSVNLLDATMAALNRPAPALALTMAAIAARYVPVTDLDARVAVEGVQLDEVC